MQYLKRIANTKLQGWWWRVFCATSVALWLVLLTTAPVLAAEVRGGMTTTINREEVINEDLFATGGAVTVDGVVNGDVFAAAGSVTINGEVTGSVTAGAGTVTISGKVGRALRAGGGLIRVDGSIGGDVMLLGQRLELGEGSTIGGKLYMALRRATLYGTVIGEVGGSATQVTISGRVMGDINITVDTLVIKSTAEILGDG